MEIDAQAELDRLTKELQQLQQRMQAMEQQRNILATEIVETQGQIKLLRKYGTEHKAS